MLVQIGSNAKFNLKMDSTNKRSKCKPCCGKFFRIFCGFMTAPIKDVSPERRSIRNVLRMRAWIGHVCVSVQKIAMLILGSNGWDLALTARN